ncbi:hypothetical protein JOF36_007433 [Pseudonocardia parietis]|uniref:Zinc finger protein n=1 Tax=Pseudonocardia parietis TaxID=570936 RepID=A0ABS4W626_9PSEU|nr:hypothetical protein [Pseudonocardia parietis]
MPITAVEDGLEHEVPAQNLSSDSACGRYLALCGAVIGPVALTVPAEVPCRACAAEAEPALAPAVTDARRSRHVAVPWLRRLRACTASREANPTGVGEPRDVAA